MEDEFAGWQRVGGRRLQFYATDDEIAEWLLEMLPPRFGPYSVLAQEWAAGDWRTFEQPIKDIRDFFADHRNANFWIRSRVLSPGLVAEELSAPEDNKRLSFRGLILIQLGRDFDGRLDEASIGIVDRIRHETTGRERRRHEYLRIFDRLRRSMRKRLVVETVRTLPDGTTTEDWRMTARAADAHVRGKVKFAAEPIGLRE
jgi:hypothetical protein